MSRLIVALPENRDLEGLLRIEDARGRVLAGPFAVCGRADGDAASRRGNPRRDPLLPFGDTPLGKYRVSAVLATGKASGLPTAEFGSGAVLLEPVDGAAALADANGRFRFLIRGGALGSGGRLRPTNGSLRLSNADLKKLVAALKAPEGMVCELVPLQRSHAPRPVAIEAPCDEGDPLGAVGGGAPGVEAPVRANRSRRRFAPPAFSLLAGPGDGGDGGGGGNGGGGGDGPYKDDELFPDLVNRTLTAAGAKLEAVVQKAPENLRSAANDHVVQTVVAALKAEGRALSGPEQQALQSAINLGTAEVFQAVVPDLDQSARKAVESAVQEHAGTRVRRDVEPDPQTTFKATLGAGNWTFNTNEQLGLDYSVADFARFKSFHAAVAPLTQNLNHVSVKASVGNARWDASFGGSVTISNKAATLHFPDFNLQVGWRLHF